MSRTNWVASCLWWAFNDEWLRIVFARKKIMPHQYSRDGRCYDKCLKIINVSVRKKYMRERQLLIKLLPEDRISHTFHMWLLFFIHSDIYFIVYIDYIRMPQWQKNIFYRHKWQFEDLLLYFIVKKANKILKVINNCCYIFFGSNIKDIIKEKITDTDIYIWHKAENNKTINSQYL